MALSCQLNMSILQSTLRSETELLIKKQSQYLTWQVWSWVHLMVVVFHLCLLGALVAVLVPIPKTIQT